MPRFVPQLHAALRIPAQSRFIPEIGLLRELAAPKDKTFQERAKDLTQICAHTLKDMMKTAEQSVKSISTGASTSAEYDPLNIVDTFLAKSEHGFIRSNGAGGA